MTKHVWKAFTAFQFETRILYIMCVCVRACVPTYNFFFIPVYHYLDTAAVLLYYFSEVYTSFVNEFRFHALFDGRPRVMEPARFAIFFFRRVIRSSHFFYFPSRFIAPGDSLSCVMASHDVCIYIFIHATDISQVNNIYVLSFISRKVDNNCYYLSLYYS